ncbi:hypothetical protein LTR24_005990 [Lithohypha guttulata]|uniref:Uncharacterized protein n=1 Tax=Lithohypha guttulata TaxID=1690604 RepID=A0ABR0K7J1_9EURO|nr:hypothetical protein LTR24_005990 [Lithohypha guttulata]
MPFLEPENRYAKLVELKDHISKLKSCQDKANNQPLDTNDFRDLMIEVMDQLDELSPFVNELIRHIRSFTGVDKAKRHTTIYLQIVGNDRMSLRTWMMNSTMNYDQLTLRQYLQNKPYRKSERPIGVANYAAASLDPMEDFLHHLFECLHSLRAGLDSLWQAMYEAAIRDTAYQYG